MIFHTRRRERRVSGKTQRRTLEMTACGHSPCVLRVFFKRALGYVCVSL